MKIELKESWDQVTLKEYIEYDKILNMDLEMQPHTKQCLILESISNASYEDILKAKANVYESMVKTAMFLTVPPKPNTNKSFELKGVDYMIVNFDDMTAGESISLEQILIKEKQTGLSYLAEALAIMIRPVVRNISTKLKTPDNKYKIIETIEEFDIKTLQSRSELFMEELTVPYLIGFLTVLSTGETPLGATIKKSLGLEKNTQLKEQKKK